MAADAVDYASYALMDADTLATLKAAVLAEMQRQLVAGGQFGMPGGHHRGGVSYATLERQLLAINAAQQLQQSGVTDLTVADLS